LNLWNQVEKGGDDKMKTNTLYTDKWNETASDETKALLGFWSLVTIILILLGWFWTSIPELLSLIERGNTSIYLISISFIYRHFFLKGAFFIAGFIGLVWFLSQLGV
jgi:hypothetical protein